MPDFAAAQAQLAQSRQAQEEARAVAAQANERLKTIAAAQKNSSRRQDPHDRAGNAERARLDALHERTTAAVAAARDVAQRASEAARAALDGFTLFSDPRQNVGRLSDDTPFALFPVRLETRFATVGSGAAVQHQLWVRIYPDDCSIDTFEATLSATELRNAQRYWQAIWRAGGIEADERAAWAGLVAAHGSGRAGYIVDNYQPVNLADKPVKAEASDEILTISTQAPLAAAEAGAVAAYWQAFWLADNNLAKQQAVRTTLDAAAGGARAEELIAAYRPGNLADKPAPPLAKTDVGLSTAFVVFPSDPPTKQAAWSEAPRVTQFPERFVVLGFNNKVQTLEAIGSVVTLPLYVGPDPSADPTADPASAIHPDGGDLFIPDPLHWMMDFDRAVAAGMGLAIDLNPAQAAAGFDRLLVLGLQLSASAGDGKEALETLLQHHGVSRAGLSLVPQGTPTHNSSGGTGTGYTALNNADQSFDDRKHGALFTPTSSTPDKRDGQWLGELLGVDPALFQTIHGADGRDQLQARAMQHALWPATLGYWMDKLLTPVFNNDAIANTRWFFTEFVSGRGPAPALRIGGQPYGVLPTTAFSRIRWLDLRPGVAVLRQPDARLLFLRSLLTVLRAADADWDALKDKSPHLGAAQDAHQQLLDIVGLHPASVEFYSRYAESLSKLFNTVNLWGFGPGFIQALLALGLHDASAGLLARLGYRGETRPDIFNHFFLRDAGQITQVIDDRPLSETAPVRPYTTDGRNYLAWLASAANTSLEALRLEAGFQNNQSPEALLYLYLRHALMLGYYDTSYQLHKAAGILSDVQLAALKPEPPFVHVAAEATAASESRFSLLYKAEPAITGHPTQLVSEYITQNFRFLTSADGLRDQVDALGRLIDASTAQLERAFVEHIDLCSYRFDAWMLGIVNFQLQQMRALGDGNNQPRTGVYLGAYAWLENLRPSPSRLTPARLAAGMAENFAGAAPIQHDPANGGYVHAPSLPHARTAAILRTGYLANATPANPETMAVNLSSRRVRLALSLLEGIRNGQPLGALLGYQFERGLHDAHALAEVDKFIYPLRKAFPLVADTLAPTKTPPDVPIEAIEARNVFDGRKLIAQINAGGQRAYPFGLTTLPPANTAELAALNTQTDALLDAADAIADLALAEGVHQAAQGNFERIAGTIDAYSSGNFPPEPQVVQTPPDGIGLTHRVAVHLPVGLAPSAAATPRAQAQPAVDAWLADVLPPLNQIGCVVTWTDPAGNPQRLEVTCADLAISPLDLLALIKPDQLQMMTELDDRVVRFVTTTASPRPDATLKIAYLTAPAGKFSVFEISALARAAGSLLRGARPLKSSDATLSQAATPATDADVFVDRNRVALPFAALDTLGGDMDAFLATLAPLVADPIANRTALINGIDGFLADAVALLERGARFSLPASGWGFAYAWRHDAVRDLLAQVAELLARWQAKLTDFDNKLLAYDALPAATSDDDRFAALRAAELVLSTQLAPLPATPALLRTLLNTKRAAFDTRRGQFAAVVTSAGTEFIGFYNAVNALLPIAEFDVAAFETTEFGDRAVRFAQDLSINLTGHKADLAASAQKVKTGLDAHDAAGTATARATALEAAAKALFGDDFRLVPEFGISAAQGSEWANAVAASTGGALLTYLQTTAEMDFPVEEWLGGVARVRPMMHTWETVVTLSGALGQPEPRLTPIQFPFEADAPWLALQFPSTYRADSDRLLYTAFYPKPFDKTTRQCGLLLDEWTETIPATTHTSGLTFHFNRPDNEAPQAILLVTPASGSGHWEWDDLVGALHETLDLAKKRAVEPAQLDSTPYAPLLPATVMAATLHGISIATNLSVANGVLRSAEITSHA